MVVVALWGPNIPILPVSLHNSALFPESYFPVWKCVKTPDELRLSGPETKPLTDSSAQAGVVAPLVVYQPN